MNRPDNVSSAADTTLPALPLGWIWTRLGTLLQEPLRNGHSAKATSDPGGIRTLTLTAVTKGDFSEENTKLTVAQPEAVADLWLRSGDLLIERSNTPELVGTARLFRGPDGFAIFPDLLIRARLLPLVSDQYIEAVLQSEASRRYLRARARGIAGSMPKIDQATIECLPVPLPPLAEQRRIVAAIQTQFTRLDAATVGLGQLRAKLRRY